MQPAAWPFASSVTMLFLLGFIAYVLGLDAVLQKGRRKEHGSKLLSDRLWHLADNPAAPAFVRYCTEADKG